MLRKWRGKVEPIIDPSDLGIDPEPSISRGHNVFNRAAHARPVEQMIVISERINGLFRSVGRAIDDRDENFVQALALRQVEAGATVLDVNTGPGRDDAVEAMRWLVHTVQEVTDVQLCIDSPDVMTVVGGMEVCDRSPIINSTTAEAERMAQLFPLCQEHDAEIICLAMDERGIPNDAESRTGMAMVMVTTAMEHGIMPDRLLIDPLVLPVRAAQDQSMKVVDAVRMLRMLDDPPLRTVVGLSNVSNGAKMRGVLNRTYLAMLMGAGLSAAICDPEDQELMDVLKAGQVLRNERLYADDFLRA